MDYAQIAASAIPAIIAFVVGYLVKRGTISKATLTELSVYGHWVVQAAEEAYADMPESGEAKLQHAMTMMTTKFGISPEEARTIILSTVRALNKAGALGDAPAKANIAVVTPNNPATS